jgi:hypothetical protein
LSRYLIAARGFIFTKTFRAGMLVDFHQHRC